MATFSRRGLHGRIVDVLGRRIIRGELAPGEIIDPDVLLGELNVSRTVIREAMKVLTAKGLVDARPRHGTFVTERERWQLLDDDVMTWRSEGSPDARLLLELSEVRQILEPAAARLAAQRRTEEQCARIGNALGALASTFEQDDVAAHVAADLRFHRSILEATGNELLARLEVVLEPVLQTRNEIAFQQETTQHFLDSHRAVAEAIIAGEPDRAQQAMQQLMAESAKDSAAILSGGIRRRTDS